MKKEVNHIEVLINKQLEIAGYDLNEVNYQKLIDSKDNDWFMRYTTTHEKQNEFSVFLKSYIKNKMKLLKIEKEHGYFMLMYGLRVIE